MRSAIQRYCNTFEDGCVSLRMRLFPQNFGTIKRILPGSSSPFHREGPGTEVVRTAVWMKLMTLTLDVMPRQFMRLNI